MIQTQSQKITGLSLGLILIGSALLPLINSGVGAALTPHGELLGNASSKAVARPPCRRDRDRRGPCEDASPSASPSPRSSASPSPRPSPRPS